MIFFHFIMLLQAVKNCEKVKKIRYVPPLNKIHSDLPVVYTIHLAGIVILLSCNFGLLAKGLHTSKITVLSTLFYTNAIDATPVFTSSPVYLITLSFFDILSLSSSLYSIFS